MTQIHTHNVRISKGDMLEAIDPCIMTNGYYSLKVGKKYEVLEVVEAEDEVCVLIIDEENEDHYFPLEDLNTYFKKN